MAYVEESDSIFRAPGPGIREQARHRRQPLDGRIRLTGSAQQALCHGKILELLPIDEVHLILKSSLAKLCVPEELGVHDLLRLGLGQPARDDHRVGGLRRPISGHQVGRDGWATIEGRGAEGTF